MSVQRKIMEISDLSIEQKDMMFSLMTSYYANTYREQFEKDLAEKNWVLLLLDEKKMEIVGFSTQMLFPFSHLEKNYKILYSGDTIIRKEYWGSLALSLLFGELMIKLLKEYKEDELYWLLISKGLRTYKYLPSFYIEYFPCFDKVTPQYIQELMQALGEYKFPDTYVPERGIVKASNNAQYLKEEYHPEAKPNKKHEVFFYESNPGYEKGDELLCLTRLSLDNINPFIKRLLDKYV